MSNAIRSQNTRVQRGTAQASAPGKTIATISNAAGAPNILQVTTQTAHGLSSGDLATHIGIAPAAYNGTYPVQVISATSYQLMLPGPGVGNATAVGTYTAVSFVYADVDEPTDVKFGGISVSQLDVSHMQSTAKEFIPGLVDNGSVDFTCNFTNSAVQNQLLADQYQATVTNWRVILGGIVQRTFAGFVSKFDGPTAKTDSKMDVQVSLKISGAIVSG